MYSASSSEQRKEKFNIPLFRFLANALCKVVKVSSEKHKKCNWWDDISYFEESWPFTNTKSPFEHKTSAEMNQNGIG